MAAASVVAACLRNSFHSKRRLNGSSDSARHLPTAGRANSLAAETQGPMAAQAARYSLEERENGGSRNGARWARVSMRRIRPIICVDGGEVPEPRHKSYAGISSQTAKELPGHGCSAGARTPRSTSHDRRQDPRAAHVAKCSILHKEEMYARRTSSLSYLKAALGLSEHCREERGIRRGLAGKENWN